MTSVFLATDCAFAAGFEAAGLPAGFAAAGFAAAGFPAAFVALGPAGLAAAFVALAAAFADALARVAFGALARLVLRFGVAVDRRRVVPDPDPVDPVDVSSAIAFSSAGAPAPLSTSADPIAHGSPVNASLTLDEMAVDRPHRR
jgi:hypothetical protein